MCVSLSGLSTDDVDVASVLPSTPVRTVVVVSEDFLEGYSVHDKIRVTAIDQKDHEDPMFY